VFCFALPLNPKPFPKKKKKKKRKEKKSSVAELAIIPKKRKLKKIWLQTRNKFSFKKRAFFFIVWLPYQNLLQKYGN
jgi:hypothetical protein